MTIGRIPSVDGGIQPTVVDAKGDLIVATAADTVSRLAVGTNNHVLTADSSTATGLKWAAAAGGGKVLQVVNATYSTAVSNSTTTYADTGLTASITPSAATSKILVLVDQAGIAKTQTNANSAVGLRLLRGATEIVVFGVSEGYTGTTLYNYVGSVSTCYLDSPNTTSSTTYKTQLKNAVAASGAYAQGDNATSTITLLEIGA